MKEVVWNLKKIIALNTSQDVSEWVSMFGKCSWLIAMLLKKFLEHVQMKRYCNDSIFSKGFRIHSVLCMRQSIVSIVTFKKYAKIHWINRLTLDINRLMLPIFKFFTLYRKIIIDCSIVSIGCSLWNNDIFSS